MFENFDLQSYQAKPFLKWVGGKKSSAAKIIEYAPNDFARYWEPFLGGGYIYFALEYRIEKAHLSDINQKLITTYKMVAQHPDEIHQKLYELASTNTKQEFYKVRDQFNSTQDPIQIAVCMIYLTRKSFHGIYKVNEFGQYISGFGDPTRKILRKKEYLFDAAMALKKADIECHSYHTIEPQRGDLVYCDPPYYDNFQGYTGTKFTASDQVLLRDCCVKWRDAGVHVMASNSDCEFIRKLYSDFKIIEIRVPRMNSTTMGARGFVTELLITN